MKLVLEGAPGVGKTTVARRLVSLLRDADISVSGFLTTEVRTAGRRVGFEIETVQGQRGVLAHVDFEGPPRVGRYGVDLDTLERVALPAVDLNADAVVVDELGNMELASRAFRDTAEALFDARLPIVVTVHARRHPFTDRLKRRNDIHLVRVSSDNRDALPRELERMVTSHIAEP